MLVFTHASVVRITCDAMLLPFLAFAFLWPSAFSAGPSNPANDLSSARSFSLSDLKWTLRNQNGSIVIPVRFCRINTFKSVTIYNLNRDPSLHKLM